ncbi:MAG: LLM class flavin-dependent oxidoreductase [Chloroflexi bacterium]|nr:LLM class flavin-dependent oxidoreductase [Chloroflexota bacterium]
MPAKANIAVLIPKAFAGPMPTPQEYTSFFRSAESLGFHSLWTTERIIHQINILDAFTALAWAATVTSRIKLGSAVTLALLRHPLVLARTVSSLDYLSGGRFILGLSLGGHPEELEAMEVDVRQRRRRLEETIALLRQLWDHPDVSFQGRHYHTKKATVAPHPAAGKRLPILLGGSADPLLHRVVAMADGWLASSSVLPDQLRERRDTLHRMARETGRETGTLEIGKLLYLAIDDDPARARKRIASSMQDYYGAGFDVDRLCPFGPPEVCARSIQPYLDAGVTTLMLGLAWPSVRELERLHHEVLPLLDTAVKQS